jgi:hypothetical protein
MSPEWASVGVILLCLVLVLGWYCLGLYEKNKVLSGANKALRAQNEKLREELAMRNIQEKASDWRRDRRSGDMIVDEE